MKDLLFLSGTKSCLFFFIAVVFEVNRWGTPSEVGSANLHTSTTKFSRRCDLSCTHMKSFKMKTRSLSIWTSVKQQFSSQYWTYSFQEVIMI